MVKATDARNAALASMSHSDDLMLTGNQVYVLILIYAGVDHLLVNHDLHASGKCSLATRE